MKKSNMTDKETLEEANGINENTSSGKNKRKDEEREDSSFEQAMPVAKRNKSVTNSFLGGFTSYIRRIEDSIKETQYLYGFLPPSEANSLIARRKETLDQMEKQFSELIQQCSSLQEDVKKPPINISISHL